MREIAEIELAIQGGTEKIETLGEAEAGDASAAENLEMKQRELDKLTKSIETLNKKIQGQPTPSILLPPSF